MSKDYSWCCTWIKEQGVTERGRWTCFGLLWFMSKDTGACTGNYDTAHVGVMCVLMDMQNYSHVLRKVSRRVYILIWLKRKDWNIGRWSEQEYSGSRNSLGKSAEMGIACFVLWGQSISLIGPVGEVEVLEIILEKYPDQLGEQLCRSCWWICIVLSMQRRIH